MQKFTDETLMPFGKYKGQKMANVPAGYLVWAYENMELKDGPLKLYLTENIENLRLEKKANDKNNHR